MQGECTSLVLMAMRAVGDLQAGNWCMMLFYIRDTDAARAKLDAVKAALA